MGGVLITSARPIGDHIFVQPIAAAEKIGSIIIPQRGVSDDPTNPRVPCEGIIVGVGPGAHTRKKGVFVPLDVQVGDRILFSRFAGTEARIEDQDIKVIAECDVQAVIESGTLESFNELGA